MLDRMALAYYDISSMHSATIQINLFIFTCSSGIWFYMNWITESIAMLRRIKLKFYVFHRWLLKSEEDLYVRLFWEQNSSLKYRVAVVYNKSWCSTLHNLVLENFWCEFLAKDLPRFPGWSLTHICSATLEYESPGALTLAMLVEVIQKNWDC